MNLSLWLTLITVILPLAVFTPVPVRAQTMDLLIKGGHVIDPKNNRSTVMDVGIVDGTIAEIAPDIPPDRATVVIEANGLYVTPGLIDMHAHVFFGTEENAYLSNGYSAVQPDAFAFRSGVTTLVDVGGAGWKNIDQFKTQTAAHSGTRVLAFVNIVGSGMKGGPVEQNLEDMDPEKTAEAARRHPDLVAGFKLAHFEGPDWTPVDRVVEAGRLANLPVMIDFGSSDPELPLDELLLRRLRPGDIFTHAYAHVRGRTPIVDEKGTLRPFVQQARQRGIIFDVGHGGGSFVFTQAIPAMKQGFVPDVISTDLHTGSMNGGMKDLTNVMSKFLNLGMPLDEVILRTTWIPAQVLHRPDLGNLDTGSPADVSVFSLHKGDFGFLDTRSERMKGDQKLVTELTIRDGKIVWDLNGISQPVTHSP